jgi:hypothetical protein
MSGGKRIGLDLDNTLISYEKVFCAYAQARGLVGPDFRGGKDDVREALRARPGGELGWQTLQGAVYGRGVVDAELFPGADEFLLRARRQGHEIIIVSHKTVFGHYDPEKINLRDAALGWMRRQGFFSADRFGLSPANVWFTATRSEKIAKIRELSVECFVDDLPEVLEHCDFPSDVAGILFTRGAAKTSSYPRVAAHWRDIGEMVLG